MVLAHEEEAVKRTLVVVATYNEVENIAQLVEAIFFALPRAEILVIDDNSPDGTWKTVEDISSNNNQIYLLKRHKKLG